MSKEKVDAFSENPIMIGYDSRLFDFDPELGAVFPNKQIVGNGKFVNFSDKIQEFKKSQDQYRILSLGDSTATGWNSDKVYKGCLNPSAALFSYKTYSDILEEKYGALLINVGVPGYTTYQGKKQLAQILKNLAREGVHIDYVTIYLGNNDCVYNGLEDKVRIDYQISSEENVLTRVSQKDFIENYQQILHTVRGYGAIPIILIPAVNFQWRPGLRSKKYPFELEEQQKKISDRKIKELFHEAETFFESGNYEMALEKDLLLPRIKKPYVLSLKQISKDLLFIDTQTFVQDENDFVDYCHTAEKLNERIAQAISRFFTKRNIAYDRKIFLEDVPSDTYTLY